jgi:hypothetical protein
MVPGTVKEENDAPYGKKNHKLFFFFLTIELPQNTLLQLTSEISNVNEGHSSKKGKKQWRFFRSPKKIKKQWRFSVQQKNEKQWRFSRSSKKWKNNDDFSVHQKNEKTMRIFPFTKKWKKAKNNEDFPVIGHNTFLKKYKSLFKKLEIRFFPCSWIRIRIKPTKSNADPDLKHCFIPHKTLWPIPCVRGALRSWRLSLREERRGRGRRRASPAPPAAWIEISWSQRDVVYLGWPKAPSYMSPNAGGGGSCGVSANEYSCAHGAQRKFGGLTP